MSRVARRATPVTDPWLYAGTPPTPGEAAVLLMEGTSFVISDRAGDLPVAPASGLFVRDKRVLSTWLVLLDGRRPDPLALDVATPFAGVFVSSSDEEEGRVVLVRRRAIGEGMREDLTVHNGEARRRRLTLEVVIAADFAHVFAVKEGSAVTTPAALTPHGGAGVAMTSPDGRDRVVVVPSPGAARTDQGIAWSVVMEPHGRFDAHVEVWVTTAGRRLALHHPHAQPLHHSEPFRRRQAWRRSVPRLVTGDRGTAESLRRSIEDLATLRIFDPDQPDWPVVAAGAPWFMAVFGRDSLITSHMVLPLDSGLAAGTLRTLAARQGEREDEESEEEPGRILHEVRFGPSDDVALDGRGIYYGTADATPLFVMLAGELSRWQGPEAVPPGLLAHVDRALAWVETHGDPDGDGFVEYARKTSRGLVNQGWKDSWDGISAADGSLPQGPLALADVQGYVHAAYEARAELARTAGDRAGQVRWSDRAARLRERFEEAFWLPDLGWYAVALDGRKRPVDALASHLGHCLWTGIVPEERSAALARWLVSEELFTGWGVRTLGHTMGAYDALSYHNGSVWPHDTAIAVAGLARYGHMAEAVQVATGLLDAAGHFDHRLPELFAGFGRDDVPVPVPYPAACSPQAWAAAAPVEMLRALLRLRPGEHGLTCDPVLPARMLPLRLTNVMCRGRAYEVAVQEDGSWRLTPEEGPSATGRPALPGLSTGA